MSQPLTMQALIQALRHLGIKRGDRLVIHSAFRNLGPIEGGADTLIDALLACVGEDGLLVVPTFTYNDSRFDTESTPSRTGVVTELLRKRKGSIRSLHPTHSVAAFGKGAEEVCIGHHLVPGLGIDSPLDRVAQLGGSILLLGVGHTSNSTMHVAEAYASVPYKHIPFNPTWPTRIPVTGSATLEVEVYDPPGCSRAFGAIEASLRQRDVIQDGSIGKAIVQLMPGQAVIDSTVEILQHNAAALLCSDPGCYRCSQAKLSCGLQAQGQQRIN